MKRSSSGILRTAWTPSSSGNGLQTWKQREDKVTYLITTYIFEGYCSVLAKSHCSTLNQNNGKYGNFSLQRNKCFFLNFSLATDDNPFHIDKIPVQAPVIPSWLSWTKFNFAASSLISEDGNFFFFGLSWFFTQKKLYIFI